ncbi:retroviral-like aspartic protease family protein [Rhodopila sp.]|uniref:retroviral-like aspartic protease family protein n=1 Tax=Rhodopila sp. TaxID=2480087 RepID=UPI003D124B01
MKAGILVVLAWLLALPTAQAACVVDKTASVPLIVTDGAITVAVEVNGIAATFVVDTGAQRSIVSEAAARRLGLARDAWIGTTMSGIGGIESRPNADPRSLTLGGIPLVRRTLTHDTSLTVGVIPRTRIGTLLIDGMLGRDFLSLFDLDLDVPGRRLTLYRVHDCAGRFLPWQGGYAAIPLTLEAQDALIVPVAVDGTKLRAVLDSGASASLIGAPGLFRLGLRQASFADDPAAEASGLGPRAVTMHEHRFGSLRVGNESIERPLIWVAPIHLTPIVDMLLGADWLAGRRIWISFSTGQLFVATP